MHALRTLKDIDSNLINKIGMVSFDDLELLSFLSVPITAIEQPLEEIAQKIMDLMLMRLDGKGGDKNIQRLVKTKMIIRESSAKRSN